MLDATSEPRLIQINPPDAKLRLPPRVKGGGLRPHAGFGFAMLSGHGPTICAGTYGQTVWSKVSDSQRDRQRRSRLAFTVGDCAGGRDQVAFDAPDCPALREAHPYSIT